jgi:hypothetical protein
VDKQVFLIHAGVRGFLDGVEPARIGDFESGLQQLLDRSALLYPHYRSICEGAELEAEMFAFVLEPYCSRLGR